MDNGKHIQYIMMPVKCISKECENCPYLKIGVIRHGDNKDGENTIYCEHYEACINEILTGVTLMRD